ncbi:MAG: hypothetical protein LBU99_05040 [Spirochaetaceae bacterium]|nr:hypothetical protein [Spirochaetaceae bacterium]
MYRRLAIRFLFVILTLFSTAPHLSALSSQELYNALQSNGFSPKREVLSGTLSLLFPYNIILSFGPETAQEVLYFEAGQNGMDDEELFEAFTAFGKYLQEEPPEHRVDIVFTVESVIPAVPEGTTAFIESIDPTVPTAVIRVLPGTGTNKNARIHSGARSSLSPPWLLQNTITALESADIPWEVETAFLSLFRLGWMADNPVLDAFFTGDIPAIEIQLPSEKSLPTETAKADFLKELLRHYYPDTSREWDKHYSFFKIGDYSFFVYEHILILLMILATGITFFILFMFSFIFGIKQYEYRNDFKRTWYLIPVILVINGLALYLGQELTFQLFTLKYGTADGWTQYPYIAFILKGTVTFLLFTLSMLLQRFIRFPRDSFIYGFLVHITCLMNILVFAIADFSLVILFIAEYILALLFSRVRHFISILLVGIVMCIPFLFFGYEAIRAGYIHAIASLFASSIAGNAALSFLLIPIELFIIRLLVKTGHFGRKRLNRVPILPLVFTGITIILISALFILPQFTEKAPQHISVSEHRITSANMQTEGNISLTVPIPGNNNYESRTLQVNTPILQSPNGTGTELPAEAYVTIPIPPKDNAEGKTIPFNDRRLRVTASDNSYLDRKRVELQIDTELKPLRITVTVYRETGYAIFDANYPFTAREGGNICEFTLEEKPPLPLSIEFTTEEWADIYVSVVLQSQENPDEIFVTAPGRENTVKQHFLYKEEQLFHFPGRIMR